MISAVFKVGAKDLFFHHEEHVSTVAYVGERYM